MDKLKKNGNSNHVGYNNEQEDISIIEYKSSKGSVNTKIQLRQNLFSFLLEGEKIVQYGGTRAKINPKEFYLLSSGNCLMSEKIVSTGGCYKSILLFFDNHMLSDFFIRHSQTSICSSEKNTEEPFLIFEKDEFLINYIDSLRLIHISGSSLSRELQKVKLEELLLYLYEHHPEKIQRLRYTSQQADGDLIIKEIVTANMSHSLTVEELAFLCHMSLSTFKRRFANIYHSSPNKWLLEKRMQKAAHLLRQGTRTASEIYVEFGYENLSSFIQSFKQVHGITPKQYQLAR